MYVACWYNNHDIRIEDRPRPVPNSGEILLKIMSCGICGSDVVEWYRLPRAPLIPGHEIGALVAEVGASIKSYKPGDRLFVAPKVPCMKCNYCRKGLYAVCSSVKQRLPGGLAEFVVVPRALIKNGVYRLPEDISYDQSTFIEPLACVYKAQQFAALKKGQTVLVLGCGMSGLLHVKLAKAKYCHVIATDTNKKRLKVALKMGADAAIDASQNVAEQLHLKYPQKAEAVFLCTSAVPAIEQAWQCVGKGGLIVFFAVPGPGKNVNLPISDFWTKEVKIVTSYYCGPPDIEAALNLLSSKAIVVDDMITHKLPLQEAGRAFQLVLQGEDSIKVIITPHTD